MKIITRQDAIKQGLKYYFTGIKCKNGHLSKRSVHNCTCYKCKCTSRTVADNKNPKGVRDRQAKYYKENENAHKKCNARGAKYRATKRHATPSWANIKSIRKIYENCPKGFHVDHIIPLRSNIVCGLHVENNLQLLDAKSNCSKSNKFIPQFISSH